MARLVALRLVNNTSQLQRELRMMTGAQKADLMMRADRGEQIIWRDRLDEAERCDGEVIVAHRLCFG